MGGPEKDMSTKVEHKTLAELEAMHTGSLMSRRKALLQCKETAGTSEQIESPNSQQIEFKDTAAWRRAYQELKGVLDKREHMPSKQERKAMRQAKAKARGRRNR